MYEFITILAVLNLAVGIARLGVQIHLGYFQD